ncbi:MAG: WD40 repeat domain-containing protein [Prosthecobacter sp.]
MKPLLALLMLGVGANAEVPVSALTFTPDGGRVVYNGAAGLVIRDLEDKASPESLLELDWPKVTDVRFDPSGRWLAVAGGVPGEKGGVRLLEWPSKRVVALWAEVGDLVTAVAWNHAGDRLAAAGHDQSVRVFSVADGGLKESMTLSGHTRPVYAVSFSPDDQQLVSAGEDRTLKVWNTSSGELVRTLAHHTDAVHALAFRPDSPAAYCASAGGDQTVRVWQPAIGRMVRIIRHHDAAVFAVAWHPQGDRLCSAGEEGIVRIIDADSDQVLHSWQAHEDWIYRIAFSPDGRRLATGGWNGSAKVWDLKTPPAVVP